MNRAAEERRHEAAHELRQTVGDPLELVGAPQALAQPQPGEVLQRGHPPRRDPRHVNCASGGDEQPTVVVAPRYARDRRL